MNWDQITLADAIRIHPDLAKWVHRCNPADYDDFCKTLYKDLDSVVGDLEETRSYRSRDKEDRISREICLLLKRMGYTAEHDVDRNGHGDFLVAVGTYEWIGEAKIYSGIGVMLEGFLQLTTRYGGRATNTRGGLLAYIKRGATKEKMEIWRQALLDGEAGVSVTASTCSLRPQLNFFTTHTHQDTGLPMEVWHVGVTLQWNPRDKSARTSKARKKKTTKKTAKKPRKVRKAVAKTRVLRTVGGRRKASS